MIYERPKVLAESFVLMAECRPTSKPTGRPCNPPRPGARRIYTSNLGIKRI